MTDRNNIHKREEVHVSVLKKEVIANLDLKAGENVADLTFGAGGHSWEILQKVGLNGRLLGVDRDQSILDRVHEKFSEYSNLVLVCGRFSELSKIAKRNNFNDFDAILLDLGISSWQIDNNDRGFSYSSKSELDMRMGQSEQTAAMILNEYSEQELARIFWENADIERSRQLAKRIICFRKAKSFKYTTDLKELLEDWLNYKEKKRNYYARIWQALRMEVNNELKEIESGVVQAIELLKKGGRLVIISFHSKEDRLIKNIFVKFAKGCICPKEFPQCLCHQKPKLKILTKKPITPTTKELEINIRSHSAKMRVGVRI